MTEIQPAKGKRPTYVERAVDDVIAMTMAVAQELAVLRERCDTYERLLADRNILGPDDVDRYVPTPDVDAQREQWRRDYLDRVLGILQIRAAGASADADRG